MAYGYIYKITNKINNKYYIGQRKGDFDDSYYGSGIAIKKAIKKYGKENFTIEVLSFCNTPEELDKKETSFIGKSFLNNDCYNMAPGGRHSKLTRRLEKGFKHSEETKRKISDSHKGKHLSEQHRKSLWKNVDKTIDPRCRKGIKHLTEEQKRKISKTLKEKYESGYKNPNKGRLRSSVIKTLLCEYCNKEFERKIYFNDKKKKFCSQECQRKYRARCGGKRCHELHTDWSETVKKGWKTKKCHGKMEKR